MGRGGRTTDGLVLPTPPGRVRRFLARHPRVMDWVVIVVAVILFGTFLAGGSTSGVVVAESSGSSVAADDALAPTPQVTVTTQGPVDRPPPAIALAVAAMGVGVVALWWRRTRSLGSFVAVLTASVVSWLAWGAVDPIALPFSLYAVAVYRSARTAWAALGVTVALSVAAQLVIGWDFTSLTTLSSIAVALVLFTMLGANLGNRRRYLASLVDLAHQLAAERDVVADLAAEAERHRIAQEMHDVVAHSLAVMISLADGAARAAPRSPTAAADAMEKAAETGRDALAEMRRVLRAAHDRPGGHGVEVGDVPRRPMPGLADLPDAVATVRDAGLPVTLRTSGAPPRDVGMQLAAYRMVQESLTNALRYAGGATMVRVTVTCAPNRIEIEVLDDGVHAAPSVGSGQGIPGMRERARVYGGSLEAGPVPGHGWRVHAVLVDAFAGPPADGPAGPAATPADGSTEERP